MGALDGRVIAITGAAGGLGRAYARLCAQEGARLVLNDLGTDRSGRGSDPAVVQGVVGEVADLGAEGIGNNDDITTMDGAQRLVEEGLDAFGEIHGLINSGGMLRDRMFVSMDVDEWDAIVRGHLRAHFCPTRVLAAHWRQRTKDGDPVDAAVVMTTSNAGLFSQPGQSNYAAAKAGIAGLTVTLADELARYGVRVNAISPAARTRMTTEVPQMAEMVAAPDDPGDFDVFDPMNVAPVVAWLCSAGCEATGQVFFVRGGEVQVLRGWREADRLDRDAAWTVDDLQAAFAGREWECAPRA